MKIVTDEQGVVFHAMKRWNDTYRGLKENIFLNLIRIRMNHGC